MCVGGDHSVVFANNKVPDVAAPAVLNDDAWGQSLATLLLAELGHGRVLSEEVRGTIGDVAGRRSFILNRRWRFSSVAERRWVLADVLGHVLLDHQLVESTPGKD